MGEFQVELGFTLANEDGPDNPGDVDLLETFGQRIEVLTGEMGPATSLVGDQYVAASTVDAETPLKRQRAADVSIEAMTAALKERGAEFAAPPLRAPLRASVRQSSGLIRV